MDLRLRPYQLSDQSALAALANNPQVSANLKDIFPYPYTPQDAQNYLNFITQNSNNNLIEYAIIVDGLFAGAISITFGEDIYSHLAEIGYWLGEPYWHQGIMKKAVKMGQHRSGTTMPGPYHSRQSRRSRWSQSRHQPLPD